MLSTGLHSLVLVYFVIPKESAGQKTLGTKSLCTSESWEFCETFEYFESYEYFGSCEGSESYNFRSIPFTDFFCLKMRGAASVRN